MAALIPGQRVILVVDDSKKYLDLFTQMLVAEDHEVVAVSSGAEALKALYSRRIDVILLDLIMPGLTGFSVLKKIREDPRLRAIPIIMTTSLEDPAAIVECLEAGATDFILKTSDPQVTLTRIGIQVAGEHAKERLVVSEERYRTLVQAIPAIIYRIDTEGLFTFLNQHVDILGFTPEELIGQHFSRIVHPDDLKNVMRSFVLPALAGRKTGVQEAPKLFDERRTRERMTQDLSLRFLRKSWEASRDASDIIYAEVVTWGEVRAAGQYVVNAATEQPEFIGTVGIVSNVTDRHRLEERHARIESELARAESEATVGRLSATVAHQINNPLSAMKLRVHLLRTKVSTPESQREHLEIIEEQIGRLARTSQDLLGFSRLRSGTASRVAATSVIKNVVNLLKPGLEEKGIVMDLVLAADLPEIRGDVDSVQEVLVNLLENARHAVSRGGRIGVKASGRDGRLVIIVEDDGPGLGTDPESLFREFFTTKTTGTGIGLGISRRICESCKGSLTGENRATVDGGGARFTAVFAMESQGKTSDS